MKYIVSLRLVKLLTNFRRMVVSNFEKSFGYKIRKVMRYIGLYGLDRTFMKIRGQYHMQRTETFEGDIYLNKASTSMDRFVGLIGCGNFPYCNTGFYLRKIAPKFLRGTYDLLSNRSLSLCADYGGSYAALNVNTLLEDPEIRLVYIASNHATHAEYAVAALDAGKHVHIEKPHVISQEQLEELCNAQERNPSSMLFLGFNRPKSRLFKLLKTWLSKEDGPVAINWFVAGHKLADDHWYYDDAEGSRISGNVCHWTDLSLQIVGLENAFPCEVHATCPPNSKSDYAISILFADQSLASISFSAKGETFEGVREILNIQRGDLIATLDSFDYLEINHGSTKKIYKQFFRDHGHKDNLINSYLAVRDNDSSRAVGSQYSLATARLFLACHQAVRDRKIVTVSAEVN